MNRRHFLAPIPHLARRPLAVVLALAALLAPAVVEPPRATALSGISSACGDGWRETALPASWNHVLPLGAATLGGQPQWLFGIPTVHAPQYPAIARWVDGAWQSTPVPWTGRGSVNAIHALGPDSAWAVGGKKHAISARWNGIDWQSLAVPRPAGRMSVFTDVSALSSEQAWMVGARLATGRLRPIAMEYRRGRWFDRSPSIASGAEGGLKAIERGPDGRLWAAGWLTRDGEPRPWLLRYAGGKWQGVPISRADPGRAVIMSLAFTTSGEGWLAGHIETDGGGYAPLLQRWDGVGWTNQPTPWTATSSVYLSGASVDSAGRVTITGTRVYHGARRARMAVLDGGQWRVSSLPGLEWLMGSGGLDTGSLAVGMTTADKAAAIINCQLAVTPGSLDPGEWRSHPADDREALVEEHGLPASEPQPAPAYVPAEVTGAGVTALEVTKASGLTLSERTYSGLAGDFNGDGYADLFTNRHGTTPSRFMLGSASGVFSEASYLFSHQDRHGCSAADVNLDDVLDMFCPVGAYRGTRTTSNELVLGPLPGGGTLAMNEYGLLDSFGRGRQSTFLNLDGDAYPDLYVTNWPDRIDAMSSSNRLYRNVDGEDFVSAAEWGADRSLGGNCVTAADLDADGDDELLLCSSESHAGLDSGARLLHNTGRRLVDRTVQRGLAPMSDRDIEVADFDGDGRLDVAQLRSNLLRISLADPAGMFVPRYELAVKGAVAMAVGDVNEDGRPDIYVLQQSAGHLMLVNDGAGTSFTSLIVAASAGSADDVLAVDYDNNGHTDFFSLNGRYVPGPVRLVAFFPAGEAPAEP